MLGLECVGFPRKDGDDRQGTRLYLIEFMSSKVTLLSGYLEASQDPS